VFVKSQGHISYLKANGLQRLMKWHVCIVYEIARILKKVIEFILGGWNSIVSKVTWLQTERSRVRITVGASYFPLL